MVYPLLPAFVTGVLGAGAVALGTLDGAAEFAAAFVKFGSGRLSDRSTRRGPLIVLGYVIAVVVRPVIAVTAAAWQVIGLRVVDRVGKGIRTPPRDALIADVTPPELRGRAFGLQRGMAHAGAGLALHVVRSSSSFAGGALSDRIGPARTMWLGWVAYALIAAGFALARGPGQAWALFLALGLVAGLTESPERALVARASAGYQGSGFGGYHGWTGLAALAGGVVLGWLFQGLGAALAFGVSATGGAALVLAWPMVSQRTEAMITSNKE